MINIIGMIIAFTGTLITGLSVLITQGNLSKTTWGDLSKLGSNSNRTANWTIVGLVLSTLGFVIQLGAAIGQI